MPRLDHLNRVVHLCRTLSAVLQDGSAADRRVLVPSPPSPPLRISLRRTCSSAAPASRTGGGQLSASESMSRWAATRSRRAAGRHHNRSDSSSQHSPMQPATSRPHPCRRPRDTRAVLSCRPRSGSSSRRRLWLPRGVRSRRGHGSVGCAQHGGAAFKVRVLCLVQPCACRCKLDARHAFAGRVNRCLPV